MATVALKPGYHGEFKDKVENFGGNIIVYIGWDKHLWFCSAKAFPLPPQMPFGALVAEVIPAGFSQHPQFKDVDWTQVEWTLNHQPFTPDPEKSLEEQGFDHKCLLRFRTPNVDGMRDASI